MLVTSAVTVTDVPTLILPENSRRQTYIARNTDDTDTVRLGAKTVSFTGPARGFSLAPGEAMSWMSDQFVRESCVALYGICDTGVTVAVEVMTQELPALT